MFLSRFAPLILVMFITVAMVTSPSGVGIDLVGMMTEVFVLMFSFLVLYHRKMKEVSVGSRHTDGSMLLSQGKRQQNNKT